MNYEGAVLFKDRHPDLQEELRLEKHDLDEIAAILEGGGPGPYLAVIVADGDAMGATISNLESPDKHRWFSKTLAEFADEAREIVEKHHGVLIYAGGDDVLALAPVDTCLKCARELHCAFNNQLSAFKNSEGKSPTLSVGVAIGHFMENLEDLREYGLGAEKDAKALEGKDALAVHLHKRGGGPVTVRGAWSERLDERLIDRADRLNRGLIPSRLPYELRTMAKVYEGWPESDAEKAIQGDLARLISKKQSKSAETVKKSLESHLQDMNSDKLMKLAQTLLIARHLKPFAERVGTTT